MQKQKQELLEQIPVHTGVYICDATDEYVDIQRHVAMFSHHPVVLEYGGIKKIADAP
ncbi:MAG: hypothetical protein HY929_07895 [Euryarchaeota archaeon]|nr:hypothetical protein [Euryarchaeota archaeon]